MLTIITIISVSILWSLTCNGLRIESRGKELDFQDEHRDTPLLDFLNNVRLVYRHELHKKKANQLPKGFKIENAQKTDFKCPNCSLHFFTGF
jgi:hypothetical protein